MAKRSTNDTYGRNASRNLFSFIHQKNKTLEVHISSVTVPVRGASRHKHKEQMRPWPVLYFSDWVKTTFADPYNGYFLLGGYKIHQEQHVTNMLKNFWERYQFVDTISTAFPSKTVPYFLHGDEGRGQCKRPVMILSAQPVLGWGGENRVTSKKYLSYRFVWYFFVCVMKKCCFYAFQSPQISCTYGDRYCGVCFSHLLCFKI